jgi:hypothetical protein
MIAAERVSEWSVRRRSRLPYERVASGATVLARIGRENRASILRMKSRSRCGELSARQAAIRRETSPTRPHVRTRGRLWACGFEANMAEHASIGS